MEVYSDLNLKEDLENLNRLWNPPESPYFNDPVRWVHERAHQETWSKQREIMKSVAENRYTAVKSCHGPGKSFIGSQIVGWWLDTKPDPFIVTSAPTSHQVRSVLWRYIRRTKQRVGLPGKISQGQVPEWKIAGELVAFGRKPADYLDANEAAAAFQGIHALHVLVILDEGSGIPDWLANACETLITNEKSRLLIIGNPDNPTSWFAKAFRPGQDFHRITISAFDTPNFTGEPVSQNLSELLTSKVWVNERKRRWGERSPMYKSKVLGEFPETSDDAVFTPAIIAKGIQCDRSRYAIDDRGRAGFDVARLGPDECVVYLNRRGYVRIQHKWARLETMESVGEFRRLWPDDPSLAPPTIIDANGLGAGPYDRLKELGYKMLPFNGGEKAYRSDRYKNRRTEAYWEAREAMDEGLIDIDEEDEDLQAELLEHKFTRNSTGQIILESKEDIAKRLGHSPDRADAFVMSLQQRADVTNFLRRQIQKTKQTPSEVTVPHESEPDDLVSDLPDLEF